VHFGQSAVLALREMLVRHCEQSYAGNAQGVTACKDKMPALKDLSALILFADILTGVIQPEFSGNLQFSAYTLKQVIAAVSLSLTPAPLVLQGLRLSWDYLVKLVNGGAPVLVNIEERHFVVVTQVTGDCLSSNFQLPTSNCLVTFLENGILRKKPASEFRPRWFGQRRFQ
jgi:hypothetical protein